MAADALKDLWLTTLLPDRKLRALAEQPLGAPASDAQLLVWAFEDTLKRAYFRYLHALEVGWECAPASFFLAAWRGDTDGSGNGPQAMLHDPVLSVKQQALGQVHALLVAKPEQERNLLALLVSKLVRERAPWPLAHPHHAHRPLCW
jgi:ribosome biogenesis protein MAK21